MWRFETLQNDVILHLRSCTWILDGCGCLCWTGSALRGSWWLHFHPFDLVCKGGVFLASIWSKSRPATAQYHGIGCNNFKPRRRKFVSLRPTPPRYCHFIVWSCYLRSALCHSERFANGAKSPAISLYAGVLAFHRLLVVSIQLRRVIYSDFLRLLFDMKCD